MPQPRAEATKRLCHDEWAASSNFAVNWAMAAAAGRGHETIVRLCHDEGGAANIHTAMAKAVSGVLTVWIGL